MSPTSSSGTDSSRPSGKAPQGPGRFRRWLLRPAMWSLAALAVLVFALHGVLQSRWAGAYFAGLTERGLEELLNRRVWVGAVHLKLVPLGIEIEDFALGGPAESDPPFLTVRRAVIDAELVDLQRRVLTIEEVLLEEPRVYLDLWGPGLNNLPKVARREPRREKIRPSLRVNVRRLALAGGELELQQRRIPIELTAQAVNADLSGGQGVHLVGRLVAGSLEITLPRANPIVGAVGLRVVLGDEGVEVLSGRLGGPDLSGSVIGHASWNKKEWVFEIEAKSHSSLFEQLGYLNGQIVGGFEVDGGFAWRERSWGFRAEMTSPVLEVFDRNIRDVRTAVSGDRNGVRFDVWEASYALGSLKGKLNVDTRPDRRAFEVDLILDQVDLLQLATDQRIPVRGVAGRVSGVFDYRFPFGHAREGQGWADLRIQPRDVEADAIPVEGSVPLLIEGGILKTQAARLVGPYEIIEAGGFYDIDDRRGEFEYRIESDRVERLAVLVPLDPSQPPLWLPASGSGVLEGTLLVDRNGASTRMRLDLEQVRAPGAAADKVQGALSLDTGGLQDLRLELLRPDGGLIVTGSVPFAGEDSGRSPRPPFLIAVDAAGWPLDQLEPWLPLEVPVAGPVSGSLKVWGALAGPSGQLRTFVAPAAIGGLSVDELELRLDFEPEWMEIDRLAVRVPAGEVALGGSFDRGSGILELAIESRGLKMERDPFAALLPGEVSGLLMIDGSVRGPLSAPRLTAKMQWRNLELDGRTLGREGAAVVTLGLADERLEVEGGVLGLATVVGGGRLDTAGFDLSFQVSSAVLEDLILLGGMGRITELSGSLEGTVHVVGELQGARQWRSQLELATLEVGYRGLRLENLEPVRASLAPDRLRIDSVFLGEPEGESEIFLNGSIQFGEQPLLDLRAQSSVATRWLNLLLPDLGLRSGQVDLLATISGEPEAPVFNGQGRVQNGRVVVPKLPFSLERIEGTAILDPDQIVVDLSADAAGGRMRVTGSVRPFDRSGAVDYRVQVSGRDLAVPYPEGWMTRGSAELSVVATEQGREARGSIDVERALYVQDVDLGLSQMLQGLFARQRLEVERADPLWTTTHLNIAVKGPGALRMRNNMADLHGSLDLLVRGTLARPAVFGTVDIEREGKLVLGPNEYIIERGELRFSNPLKIEPVVDVVAMADVREYDITLNLEGPLDRLNVTYSSNPPLADLEILSLLATGEESWTTGPATTAGETEASLRATSLLYGQAASLVAQRTGRLFGLDRFRVQPLTTASGELSSARVTVGKQLSRDLYVTYSYDPSITAEQVFEIEWKVERGVTLLLRQNGDESYGVDLVWKKSF